MTPCLSISGRRAIVSAAASGIGRISPRLAETGLGGMRDVDRKKVAEMKQRHPAIRATAT